MSKCNYCKSKLKKLRYLADFDYGINSYSVEFQHEVEGVLLYCPKCGNVQVKKIRRGE